MGNEDIKYLLLSIFAMIYVFAFTSLY